MLPFPQSSVRFPRLCQRLLMQCERNRIDLWVDGVQPGEAGLRYLDARKLAAADQVRQRASSSSRAAAC